MLRPDSAILDGFARRAPCPEGSILASDSPFKSRGGWARIAAAGRNSLEGLRAAWRDEAAFRQELALCAVLVPIALWLPVGAFEKLALVAVLAVLLIVELLNSALEAVVDRVGLERHALSKQAKDLGSAAVLIALLLVAATWATVLWPLVGPAFR
ncbi:MAG: diacylglycerol kinase [Burkholderiales bacterium]|nr:MAG: diacylglycerol kinase [Burkholderiales bacterium]